MQPLPPDHADHARLNAIAVEIVARAGGEKKLAEFFPAMLRERIDAVINTAETKRTRYEELESTDKTYIGSLVEYAIKHRLQLAKGRLDMVVAGDEVDVKTTIGNSWMIATHAVGWPCLLVLADERRGQCSLGLIVARPEYLTKGGNQDKKVQIAADARRAHIWWFFRDLPYPANFWRAIDPAAADRIFAAPTGNARMVTLFKEVAGRAIPRKVVEAAASQKDFMRRVRADGTRGTRAVLAAEGYLLLSGTYDSLLIQQLGLAAIQRSEFISHKVRDDADLQLARGAGYPI